MIFFDRGVLLCARFCNYYYIVVGMLLVNSQHTQDYDCIDTPTKQDLFLLKFYQTHYRYRVQRYILKSKNALFLQNNFRKEIIFI